MIAVTIMSSSGCTLDWISVSPLNMRARRCSPRPAVRSLASGGGIATGAIPQPEQNVNVSLVNLLGRQQSREVRCQREGLEDLSGGKMI